ncbi:hypothetical protein [Parasitella parasitica]|uniref:Histone-lysine N-methyltransferase n=1 Tax=Parasitella parasitica TaxID=35722 RepID=A0A0B7N1X0_9FUNG|nr:hypothetical protein [Parasitella parasitica]
MISTIADIEQKQEIENIPPSNSFTPDSSSESEYHDCRSDEPLTPIPIKNALTSDTVKDGACTVLASLEYQPYVVSIVDNKPPAKTIQEGVKWCQRCGTLDTPRWRMGPAGQSTLCNACHLRWKIQGRPKEGYSSTVFPPPHYNPNPVKRSKPQKSKKQPKKPKVDDEIVQDQDRPLGSGTLCNACGLKWAKCTATDKPSPTIARPVKTTTPRKAMLLHNRKEYITHGLYFDKTRIPQNQPFSFPLPMHLGEFLISKEKEFELPPDIHQERELGLIKGLMADREPFFIRIRSNIFVERKPNASKDVVVCHCVRPAKGEMGCGDDCINRMLFYECDPAECPCGDQCSNRRFQRKERTKQLQVFQTKTRGWGLRTLVDIKKGDLVIEYRGEVISHELCEERMCTIYVNDKNFYFLEYCNGEVIDACTKGTVARFINHSCEPNCHIEKWSLKGESYFGVFASQDIEAKSELFYDYNFSTFNNSVESEQPCYCGSKLCRGTIGKKMSRVR